MEDNITMRVDKETLRDLSKLKIREKESYCGVVTRLILEAQKKSK